MTFSVIPPVQSIPIVKTKTTSQANGTTTFVNDTELFVDLKADTIYIIKVIWILISENFATAPSGDKSKRRWQGQTGWIGTQMIGNFRSTVGGQTFAYDTTRTFSGLGAGGLFGQMPQLHVKTTGAGRLNLQFAQQISNAVDTESRKGSAMIVYEAFNP